MKGLKQKISKDIYLGKHRAELDGYQGELTFSGITENNITNSIDNKYQLLEDILSPINLNLAYTKVKSNKGRGGVDKMEVESLKDYLIVNKANLTGKIFRGDYRPNPVRRVLIPKDDNSKRMLGIPTVVDRVIQQSIMQILSPIYERQFSDHSYGFRPNRSAHHALLKSRDYISSGYKYSVDIDLEKFFDKVNHSKLIEILSRTIKDSRVISLIHKYLNAGVLLEGNVLEATKSGVPQGGPLSPLLSNIMLNELDKELEARGHKFVRYADDLVIFTKSKRSGNRVLSHTVSFIEDKLYLKVNKSKTNYSSVRKLKFLGYSFYVNKGKGRLRVHPKSIAKLKEKIKHLTSRSNGWGYAKLKERLKSYIQGWVHYFKYADMQTLLRRIDEWYRRRLRMLIWKQWKRVRTRGRNLMQLGMNKFKAWQFANTRKGYWRIAKSPILATSITNNRLNDAGFMYFTDYYRKLRV